MPWKGLKGAFGYYPLALADIQTGLCLLVLHCSTFQEVWPHLYKLAKAGKSPVAKVAGVEALAVVCFCCSEDPISTHEVMGQLQGLWKQGEMAIRRGQGAGFSGCAG